MPTEEPSKIEQQQIQPAKINQPQKKSVAFMNDQDEPEEQPHKIPGIF